LRGAFAAALILTALLAGRVQAQESASCAPETIGVVTVRAVLDGRTLLLTDGREVRLAGIEISPQSKPALEAHIAGREITLKGRKSDQKTDQMTDRYGRLVAYAHVGSAPSVQIQLLSQGHARVATRIGDSACAAGLFAAEAAARTARLGLWAEPHYLPRKAGNPAEILGERGRFTLVEGRVLSVRESGSVIYVNFGRRWTEDFTVTVLKRSERAFSAAGIELKKLAGRNVRIRGYIEERGGPWIEATRPEQIEIQESLQESLGHRRN
jgi:endonuclease YncB( thermonuclease family)